jgi:hypothetical protein
MAVAPGAEEPPAGTKTNASMISTAGNETNASRPQAVSSMAVASRSDMTPDRADAMSNAPENTAGGKSYIPSLLLFLIAFDVTIDNYGICSKHQGKYLQRIQKHH